MDKRTILVVEDEESLLKLESILLTSKGFEVVGVPHGLAALNVLETEKIDLVLLDVMLPEIDGFEVCRRIKENPRTRNLPVILLTAKKSHEDMVRGNEVGADWYVTKPFKSAKVIEMIEKLLAR
ncbi:MAG: response regulator [Desulfuromonadaceae bacterium]|nr:response regulator [Desulfuromonadaceae bacterium]